MADRESQAKHLTNLSLDITGIISQLAEIDKRMRNAGLEAGKIYQKGFATGLENFEIPKITTNTAKEMTQLKQREQVLQAEHRIRFNMEKQFEKQREQALQAEQKINSAIIKDRTKMYQNMFDEIEKKEKQREQALQAEIQTRLSLEKITDRALKKEINSLQELINKYKDFDARLSRQKEPNLQVQEKVRSQIQSLENLRSEIALNEKIEKQQQEQIQNSKQLLREQQRANIGSTTGRESFLSQMSDKLHWTAAFHLVQGLEQGIVDTVRTLSQVELKMSEIDRVIGDSSLNIKQYTKDIYDSAIAMGRGFDDAADIVLRFAQAGYTAQESAKMLDTTLVALNTAELDAQQATEGLIAIMHQWGITAEDYPLLIDKINKTADAYSVTSQELVNSLQQSASVAKMSGQSFDSLIGTLTVLMETSGRSGREVGNAYKSILSYIQRPQSLKFFESIGIDVFADQAKNQLLPIMDIFSQMEKRFSSSNKEMQDSMLNTISAIMPMSEEIAGAIGATEDYTVAQEKFNAKLKDFGVLSQEAATDEQIAQAQAAAGVYRRNYYISLMENFGRVQNVVNNLQNAEGYSLQENAKYMATLEAKTQQFIATLQSLTQEESGQVFLSFLKMVTDLGTGFLNLQKTMFGLPLLIGLITVAINTMKKENYGFSVSAIKSMEQLKAETKELGIASTTTGRVGAASMAMFTGGMLKARIAATALKVSIATLEAAATFGISLIITGLIELGSQIIVTKNETQEYIQTQTEMLKTLSDQTTQTNKLLTVYDELSKKTSLTEAEQQKLKETVDALKALYPDLNLGVANNNKELEAQIGLIKEVNTQNMEQIRIKSEATLGELLPTIDKDIAKQKELTKEQNDYKKSISDTKIELTKLEAIPQKEHVFANVGRDLKRIDVTQKKIDDLTESYGDLTKSQDKNQTKLDALNSTMQSFAASTINLQKINLGIADGTKITREQFDKLKDALKTTISDDERLQIVMDNLNKSYPEFNENAKQSADSIEKMGEKSQQTSENLKLINDTIDSYQSGLQIITAAQEELNNTNSISVDTFQQLMTLPPEYIAQLGNMANSNNFLTDSLNVETEALRQAAIANIQQAAASDLNAIATGNASQASNFAKGAIANAGNAMATTGTQAANATPEVLGFAAAMAAASQAKSPAAEGKIIADLNAVNSAYENVLKNISGFTINTQKAGKASGGAGKASKGASKANSENAKTLYELNEATIQNINLNQLKLKMQEENIQNDIELAEAQGNYGKALSLTSQQAEVQQQRMIELTKANINLHKEAQKLRATTKYDTTKWLDETGKETKAFFELLNQQKTKKQQEDLVKLKDKIKDLKESYTENAKSIKETQIDIANSIQGTIDKIKDYNETQINFLKVQTQTPENQLKQISILEERQSKAHDQAQEERKKGLKANQNYLSQYSTVWWELEKEINDIEKEMYSDRMDISENYIEKRNDWDNWGADNEIAAWDRVLKWLKSDFYDKGLMDYKTYISERDKILRNSLEAQKEAIEKVYETEFKDIDDALDKLKGQQDVAENFYDSLKKKEEERFEQLESDFEIEKDTMEKRYEAELASIENVEQSKAEARAKDLEEYNRKRQQLIGDLQLAQASVGQEARKRQTELEQQLSDLDTEREEKLKEQAKQDQIDRLEIERKAEESLFEEREKRLGKEKENALKDIEDRKEAQLKSFEEQQKIIEAQREYLEKQKEQDLKDIQKKYATESLADQDLTKEKVKNHEIYADTTSKKTIDVADVTAKEAREKFKIDLISPIETDWIKIFGMNNAMSETLTNTGTQMYNVLENTLFLPIEQRFKDLKMAFSENFAENTSPAMSNVSSGVSSIYNTISQDSIKNNLYATTNINPIIKSSFDVTNALVQAQNFLTQEFYKSKI